MNQDSPEQPVELVAIINSFNRRSLLERAIASLTEALPSARFGSAIVAFEAGSSDGSAEFLRTWRDNRPADNLIVIEASADRRSFSDGVNIACAEAIARFPDCRWLFLYETDNCLTSAGPLEKAIALLELEPQLAAAGFTVKQHNGMFYTSPLLIRREAWEQGDGFDAKNFPFSDVDLDWAWRCAKLGWKMAVIASDNVLHDNLEQLSGWSANRALDFHRNRFRLLKRHRGKHVTLLKPFLFIRHWLETMILAWNSAADPMAKEKLAKRKQMLRTVWNDYS